MGLFRDLGRRAEKLKTQATDAAEAQADYECADCGKAIFTEREACPNCGSEAVVSRAGATGDDAADGATDDETSDETSDDATDPATDGT